MDFIASLIYYLFDEDKKAHPMSLERQRDVLSIIRSFTSSCKETEKENKNGKRKNDGACNRSQARK